ncbi:MAG TPA: hypothetical protein VMB81_18840 [Candidatus Sulfotelmatobacter sp.]|nr:hypothetical protein [Candidatus Sulfotelmatobacter sp.]
MRAPYRLGLLLAALSCTAPAHAQDLLTVNPQSALNHAGERIIVCGRVASANFAADKSLVLAIDYPYPGQMFSMQILAVDRAKFGAPELSLLDKRVCGTGTIQVIQGRAQMTLRDPNQLVLQQ